MQSLTLLQMKKKKRMEKQKQQQKWQKKKKKKRTTKESGENVIRCDDRARQTLPFQYINCLHFEWVLYVVCKCIILCLPLSLTEHLLKICVFRSFLCGCCCWCYCCVCVCLHHISTHSLSWLIPFCLCSERFITCCTMTSLQIVQWKRWKESKRTRCEKCLLWKLIWCVNTHDDKAKAKKKNERQKEKMEKKVKSKIKKKKINNKLNRTLWNERNSEHDQQIKM